MSLLQDGLVRYLSLAQRQRLGAAVVGIAGAGGLGSNCAMMLLRSGIKRFVIADHDVLDASNLNRQFYFADQVGRKKVDALAENLRAIEPEVEFSLVCDELSHDTFRSTFSKCDIIIEALDDPETKRVMVEACSAGEAFLVCASGMAGWGGKPMTTKRFGDRMVVVGDFTQDVNSAPPMAPRVLMAAALQADVVLEYLLGESCIEEAEK